MLRARWTARVNSAPSKARPGSTALTIGGLPRVAVEACEEAIHWKQAPHNLTSDRFTEVPALLRQTLARLIGAAPEDIVEGDFI